MNAEEGRQLTNFLRKDNIILKEQNKELKDLLELNREALRVSVQFKNGQLNFPTLVNLLYHENSKLYAKINKLSIDLQTGMCKALISEQIAFASSEHEKYLTGELRDKLTKMRRQLEYRQRKIVELTKLSFEERKQHSDIKLVEITELSAVNIKMHDKLEKLKEEIELLKQEVSKYKDQKDQLMKLNLILTKQINDLKIISSQQTTKSKNQEIEGDMSKFLNYQKKLVEDEDEDQSEDQYLQDPSPMSSDYEDFEEDEHNKSQMPKLQISKVPKLQLTKAKEIQELIVQKINQDEKKKQGGTVKEEKYKKLQVELGSLRKKIGDIMVQHMDIQKQNCILKRCIKQLQHRNILLIKQQKTVIYEDILNNSISKQDKMQQNTQTLLQICRDVTLNPILKDVINGEYELQKRQIISYDV